MASWIRCFCLVLWIWTSPKLSQMMCQYYSQDLPSPLRDHVAGYSPESNSVYIMGSHQTAVYKWDLTNPSEWFTPISQIPDSWWEADGISLLVPVDNILYAIGVYGAAHTVNKFDTVHNQWLANGADAPTDVINGCVAYNGSHIVMFDGWGSSSSTRSVYVRFYEIARDEWSTHTVEVPFETAGVSYIWWRNQFCAFVHGKLYIFGGKIGAESYLSGMWRYDIPNQQFISIGTLPHTCGYGTTAVDGFGNMYLVGCWSDTAGYTNEIWVFDASTESIGDDTIYSRERVTESAAVIVNRSLWIFGGYTSADTISEKVQVCDVSSFVQTTNEPAQQIPAPVTSANPSSAPSATPSAMPSSGSSQTEKSRTDLLLSIIIGLAAVGCFCVALLFYLWSRKERNEQQSQQQQQPANDAPVVQMHTQPYTYPYPPQLQLHPNSFPPPPRAAHPQFDAYAVVPPPNNAVGRVGENSVYDQNFMRHNREGARASIHQQDDAKTDDDDNEDMYVNQQTASTQQTNGHMHQVTANVKAMGVGRRVRYLKC